MDISFAPEEDLFSGANLPYPGSVAPLRIEASSRRYYRVNFPETSKIDSAVICHTSPIPDPMMDDFLVIRNQLESSGVPVPSLLGHSLSSGQLLLQDGGDLDLIGAAGTYPEKRNRFIEMAMEAIAGFHRMEPEYPVAGRSFDFEKLSWEMSFLLERIRLRFFASGDEKRVLERANPLLRSLCLSLDKQHDFVPVHRDYHGRNIMVPDPETPSIFLIDFQDSRMGLREYDLVSFVYDPYADWSSEEREFALSTYKKHSGQGINRIQFENQLNQRLLKALGSYYYLTYEKGMASYQPFILKTIDLLSENRETPPARGILDFLHTIRDLEMRAQGK